MEQNLAHTLALLERTPSTFNSLLRGLPDVWTQSNEGGSSWTAFDIVGQLVHGERAEWMPRIERILHYGESQPFEPFDREAQKHESRRSARELFARAGKATELGGSGSRVDGQHARARICAMLSRCECVLQANLLNAVVS